MEKYFIKVGVCVQVLRLHQKLGELVGLKF